jgi:hypothetical protein
LERSSFDITVVGTGDPQPTNFEPLQTRLHCQKNFALCKKISANLTHLSVSLLNNNNNNETQPQAPQKREIIQAHKTTKYLMTEPTDAVAASCSVIELLLAGHLTLLRLYLPEEAVNASLHRKRGEEQEQEQEQAHAAAAAAAAAIIPYILSLEQQ